MQMSIGKAKDCSTNRCKAKHRQEKVNRDFAEGYHPDQGSKMQALRCGSRATLDYHWKPILGPHCNEESQWQLAILQLCGQLEIESLQEPHQGDEPLLNCRQTESAR